MTRWLRANDEQAAKLCAAAEWLKDYLNIDVWPEDYEWALERPRSFGHSFPEELEGIATVEEMTDAQRAVFSEWVKEYVLPQSERWLAPLEQPAYTYFSRAEVLPAGSWLAHFTRKSFRSFQYGSTLEGLHLATHKSKKDKAECERNLSDDAGLYDIVWGFALDPDEAERQWSDMSRQYGKTLLLFKTDCAVLVYHETDNQWQVIFPLCSEYDVHMGTVEDGGFWFEVEDGATEEFESIAAVIEHIEASEAG
jgi:hypothetical protein